MKTTEIVDRGVLNERRLTELADQVDPAIGEASSVIGAMTTEIVRRSLRGGVLQIGRELSTYVEQEVEQQIVEQQPLIEKTAAIAATEVARGEVEAVRLAATEQSQRLAARIDDANRLAQDLNGRLEETARGVQEQTQSIVRDLNGRLEETSRQTHQRIELVAKTADDTARQTSETTTSLSRTMQSEIAAAETRALSTSRKEFTEQIEHFKERARHSTQKILERLDKQDATNADFVKRQIEVKQQLLDAWRMEQKQLIHQFDDLRRVNESLTKRLEVLEQPRGIRGLYARLFGKKKSPEQVEDAAEDEGELRERRETT